MNLPQQGIDIVIVSRRGAAAVQKVIMDTQKNPLFWLKSNFIVVFDERPNEVEKLQKWHATMSEMEPFPRLTVMNINDKRGDLNYLRQQGIEQGRLPFVYFQDDDDDLPINVEIAIKLLNDTPYLHAVFGVTESINKHYQIVEQYPVISADGNFKVDPVEGTRWFATYPHPSAAVFRRKTFESFPYHTDELYRVCGNGAFLTKLLSSGGQIVFIPYVIRRALLHGHNMTPPVIDAETCNALALDIENWQQYVTSREVKSFQEKIIERLRNGEITSFKEIDAMVEERTQKVERGESPSAVA
jgi:hypothetical protein